jgi:hypothetical protein
MTLAIGPAHIALLAELSTSADPEGSSHWFNVDVVDVRFTGASDDGGSLFLSEVVTAFGFISVPRYV